MVPYKTVTLIHAPISERYWSKGIKCSVDLDNNLIRCGGCWFSLDERFIYVDEQLKQWITNNF